MDAEGFNEQTPCPQCGSTNTITYRYEEGFAELECPACGYRSDHQELSDLTRYQGTVREQRGGPDHDFGGAHAERWAEDLPPVPIKVLKA